jgi:hypothetical protein
MPSRDEWDEPRYVGLWRATFRGRTARFWREVDINRQAEPVSLVANDPSETCRDFLFRAALRAVAGIRRSMTFDSRMFISLVGRTLALLYP